MQIRNFRFVYRCSYTPNYIHTGKGGDGRVYLGFIDGVMGIIDRRVSVDHTCRCILRSNRDLIFTCCIFSRGHSLL